MITVKKLAVSIDEVDPAPVKTEDGWRKMDIRFIITEETTGSKEICAWRTVFAPGAAHERHLHTESAEVIYGIRGRGAQGIGDREYELKPGVAMIIPKAEVHWLRNLNKDEPLEIFGVYTNCGSLDGSGYRFVGAIRPADCTLKE